MLYIEHIGPVFVLYSILYTIKLCAVPFLFPDFVCDIFSVLIRIGQERGQLPDSAAQLAFPYHDVHPHFNTFDKSGDMDYQCYWINSYIPIKLVYHCKYSL